MKPSLSETLTRTAWLRLERVYERHFEFRLAVLVTGGGQGLGLEITKALASAGAFVFINGQNHEKLNRTVTSVTAVGGSALPLQLDITDEAAVKKVFILPILLVIM
ncbi:SDR family NAD(P)-dependent oxidoreductase [Nostoc sp.]